MLRLEGVKKQSKLLSILVGVGWSELELVSHGHRVDFANLFEEPGKS